VKAQGFKDDLEAVRDFINTHDMDFADREELFEAVRDMDWGGAKKPMANVPHLPKLSTLDTRVLGYMIEMDSKFALPYSFYSTLKECLSTEYRGHFNYGTGRDSITERQLLLQLASWETVWYVSPIPAVEGSGIMWPTLEAI
jgi:hypothetical protein